MKKYLLPGLLMAIVMLASCKKDDNKNTNATGIQGTYKLKYLTASINNTETATDGEKTVSITDYTTINNQGTLIFDNANLSYTGLSYSVDTQAKYYIYQDNELLDSASFPFKANLPSSSGTGVYKLVGADSIYFPQGSVTSGMGGSAQTTASGGRYSFSGNLLTIIQHVIKDSTFEDSGETIHMNVSGVTSTVLEKQ